VGYRNFINDLLPEIVGNAKQVESSQRRWF
jgi:hypothetical protein